jgi:putative transcriptional regulator
MQARRELGQEDRPTEAEMNSSKQREPFFERLKTGLQEAIRHARGEITLKTKAVELPDPPPSIGPKALTSLRLENRMSQAVFARILNVSTKTVQSWEQGARKPSQAALRLIQVFSENPNLLLRIAGMSTNGASPATTSKRPERSARTPSRRRAPSVAR